MPCTLIDGKTIAEQVNAESVGEIARLKSQHDLTPGLAVVLVGDNPASATYVAMKDKMCARLGMHSERINLPATISEGELLAVINVAAADARRTGPGTGMRGGVMGVVSRSKGQALRTYQGRSRIQRVAVPLLDAEGEPSARPRARRDPRHLAAPGFPPGGSPRPGATPRRPARPRE